MRKKGRKQGCLSGWLLPPGIRTRGPWDDRGRDPESGRVEQQQPVTQFAKCGPSLYLLEKACAHIVGLGE